MGEQTHATLLVFVFLMLNHPEVQHRAQLEIDHVVGGQQLPDFEDRPPLPYVDAVLRESLRCRLVGPLGTFDLCTRFLDLLTLFRHSSCHHQR